MLQFHHGLQRLIFRQILFKQNTCTSVTSVVNVPVHVSQPLVYTKLKFTGCMKQTQTMSTSSDPNYHKSKKNIRGIFDSAVAAVLPRQMIERAIKIQDNNLTVNDEVFPLSKNLYVVGFGKAVSGMARTVEDLLHKHIVRGIISIPTGTQEFLSSIGKQDLLLASDSKIKVYEGAKNNLPDENAVKAAKAIKELVSDLTSEDILIVLVSGGGSTLLTLPDKPITLEEEYQLTELLSRSGATINYLNVVRKHLEVLKGGGLAKLAKPAQVISLILSDVVGDRLDTIASAPTYVDYSSPKLCLDIFKKLKIMGDVPESVLAYLNERVVQYSSQKSPGVPDPDISNELREDSKHVKNVIVGSNQIAVEAACRKALEFGYLPFTLTASLEGEAWKVGNMFGELAKYAVLSFGNKFQGGCEELLSLELSLADFGLDKTVINDVVSTINKAYNAGKGICIISGGETVVNVKGTGLGGRCQELALSCALQIHQQFMSSDYRNSLLQKFHVEFLSGATDGVDGPTDAAGAIIDQDFTLHCKTQNLDPDSYLENNDSYNLFRQVNSGSCHIKTGLTGTNVMDIQILLILPKTTKDHDTDSKM